jgi:outer membrane protein insertion porin family
VDITFEFDKGNKVYFGQINVVGNSKTRDKVVRRELSILEGELYNETRRRKSLENIQRLGFFEEVNFKTSTPNDQLDIMNVDIVVKERNTGQINFGAGYGSSSGFTLQGSVKQTNFLGRGQDLGVSLSLASNYRVYDLSFTEPYFNDTEWSIGVRAFQSQSSGSLDYDEEKRGFSLFAGHPLGEYLRGNLVYSYTDTKLFALYDETRKKYITDFDVFPLETATGSAGSLGANVEYDTRNDRFKPSKGLYARTGYTQTGFGGNLRYYKYNADFRYFKNLFWDVVFRNALSYQGIGSLDEDREPPFNELNLLGGPYSLRGYRFRRVGRMVFSKKIFDERVANGDTVTRAREQAMRFFGGKQQLMYQGELQFPLIKEADMYGVTFYDIGQAEDEMSDNKFFADTGFGIRWFSPIGPLRFEWGFPLNRDPIYHENTVFEFSIGTPF